MTKTLSFVAFPVLLLAALLAVVLPGMAQHAPDINVSFPAAQSATVPESLDINVMMSTNHGESERVIKGLSALPMTFTGNGQGFSEGEVSLWGGLHPRKAGWGSVAILWAVKGNVWFGALSAPILTTVIPGAVEVNPGQFIDASALQWDGAWILSKNSAGGASRLVDDPSQYLTFGEGWEKWTRTQAKWGYNFQIAAITVPLPPAPPPATP